MIRNPTIVPGTIPVLSLWQPWASLCVWTHPADPGDPASERVAEKQYETRGWETSYRGPVVIHAAKKWNGDLSLTCCDQPFPAVIERQLELRPGELTPMNARCLLGSRLPFMSLIGTARITDCRPTSYFSHVVRTPAFSETNEYAFGDYRPGRFAIRLCNPVAFARPIPYVGRQGWFNVEEGVIG